MPFDPTNPQNGQIVDADFLRDQFTSLKTLIDAGGVAGNPDEVQYNNAGTLAASPGLKFHDAGSAERSLELAIPTGAANLTVDDFGGGDIQSKLSLTGNNASMAVKYLDLPQEVLIQNDGTGGVTLLPSVKTGNPGSGAGRWQLGQVQTGAVVLEAARYGEVSIHGVVVKLLVAA